MEIAPLGTTDLNVARLGLGSMNFGAVPWGSGRDEADRIFRVYRDAGGNFLDTANIYVSGESERILGDLIAGSRDELVLASKVGFPVPGSPRAGLSPANVRSSLVETLRSLRTDYLDLYQLHAYDPTVGLDETLGVLHDLVEEGQIRYAGSSNFFAWQMADAEAIARAHGWHGLVSAQMMYNLVRRDIEREHIPFTQHVGLGLIAYSPLHGGHLAAAWRSRAEVPSDSRARTNPDVYLADEDRLFAVTNTLVRHAHTIGATPGQLMSPRVV